MEIKNEDKFSSFTESIKQLDKQGFELMSDIKLLSDELSNIDNKINDTELRDKIEELKQSINDIQLQKGDTGEKGDKGDVGEKGKDGLNGRDGIDGLDGLNGKDGENGKDGSPDTPEQIIEKINTLENVINIKTIKDFPKIEGTEDIKRQVDTIGNQVLRLMSKQTPAPIAPNWASITGTQSDVNVGGFTNDVGYLTSTDLTGYLQNNLGIAGGTTLIGSTAIGENLTLQSTSNATKGKILFGTSAYDEVNNRLGIGQATPTARLHIQTNALGTTQTTSSGILLENATAAASGLQQISPALELKGSGWKTTATAASQTVAFRQYVLPEQNITNPTGALLFQSDVNGAGYNTRMAITTSGNVGIGTISPSALLSVTTIANSGTLLSLGANSQQGLFRVGYNAGATTLTSSEYGTFTIATNGGNQNINIMPHGTGKVGINTASPSSPLHVSSSTSSITGRFTGNGISNRVIIEGTGAGISAISFAETNIGSRWGIGSVLSTQAFVISKSGDLGGAGNLALEIGQSTRNMGIQLSGATAKIHIAAGSATAGTAPLKLTSGTNLTTPEDGAFEFDGSSLFFTRSGTLRAGLLMTDTASPFNTYSQSAKGATAFTSGTDNFLGGQLAGGALITGSQNVMIGTQAGNLANAGLINTVMIGYFAGQSASGTTIGSVFIGSQAGQIGVGSYNSNFIGQLAGFNASSAYHSNLFGYQAGYGISANNVNFFGQNAGYGATLANDTVGIGQNAGANATGSIESIYLGKNSGYNAVSTGITGDYNIGLGTNTLKAVTTGAGNIAIGYKVGDTITTGSKNIAIGYDIDYQSNTADGQLSIQNAIFGTGNTGTGTTASTGKIGIYTVAPTCALDVTGGIATSRTTVTAPATTDGNIFSGTYTPTLTGVTNVTSSTAYVCQYMRVGNVVTVSGKIEVTPTLNNTQTAIGISLPIASNFANSGQCGGSSYTVANTVAGHGAAIYADATNDRAEMDYFETHGASDTFAFSFTYQII